MAARSIYIVSLSGRPSSSSFMTQLFLILTGIQEKLGILHNGEVFAVFSYDAQQQDELKFIVNDKLTILRKGDEAEREWWWARTDTGHEGYVPRNLFGVSNPSERSFGKWKIHVCFVLVYSAVVSSHRSVESKFQ